MKRRLPIPGLHREPDLYERYVLEASQDCSTCQQAALIRKYTQLLEERNKTRQAKLHP